MIRKRVKGREGNFPSRSTAPLKSHEVNSLLDGDAVAGDDEPLEAGSVSGPLPCLPPRITRSPTVSENLEPLCPECAPDNPADDLDRRGFIRLLGGSAAALSLGTTLTPTV